VFPALLKIRESKKMKQFQFLKCHIEVWQNPFPDPNVQTIARQKQGPISAAITGKTEVAGRLSRSRRCYSLRIGIASVAEVRRQCNRGIRQYRNAGI
jgi:hypothetical protein